MALRRFLPALLFALTGCQAINAFDEPCFGDECPPLADADLDSTDEDSGDAGPSDGGSDAEDAEPDVGDAQPDADAGPLVCDEGEGVCDEECVNLQADTANCGECGLVCSDAARGVGACLDGACGFECEPGFADCDEDPTTGCEVDLMTSRDNCGVCGVPAVSGTVCRDGESVRVIELALGTTFACALESRSGAPNTIACWGSNSAGRLGAGPEFARVRRREVMVSESESLAGVGDATDISASENGHACAVVEGTVYCWGENNQGQTLGAEGADSRYATEVPLLDADGSVVEVEVGSGFSCARAGGDVYCWGRNNTGQLGRDSSDDTGPPGQVLLPAPAIDIDAAPGFACAVLNTGKLYCWGSNAGGVIQSSSTASFAMPVEVPALDGGNRVSVGGQRACAIRTGESGWARCVGTQVYGSLLDDGASPAGHDAPRREGDFTDVVMGTNYTCVLLEGEVTCWGSSLRGAVPGASGARVDLPDLANALYGSKRQVCAELMDARVFCWGEDLYKHLSRSRDPIVATPEESGASVDRSLGEVASIGSASCIAAGGAVSCWGSGQNGLISDNFDHSVPTRVSGGPPASAVAVGPSSRCLIGDDSQAYCWGRHDVRTNSTFGSLGSPSFAEGSLNEASLTHVVTDVAAVMPLQNVSSISIGFTSSCAVVGPSLATEPGSIYCWGQNDSRQLGLASMASEHAQGPLVLPGNADPLSVHVGNAFACSLLDDGHVACWGANNRGQAGQPPGGDVAEPTNVPLVEAASDLTVGADHACAIADGRVLCWGDNQRKQLGRDLGGGTPSVVAVGPAGDPVDEIQAGRNHTCARFRSGAVHCWGSNSLGELGVGAAGEDMTPSSEPVLTDASALYSSADSVLTCATREGSATLWCWGFDDRGSMARGEPLYLMTPTLMEGVP